MFWLYMLRCADDSYYVGHTDCLDRRMEQHHQGMISICYTVKRRPVLLAYQQEFATREEALAAERQLKGLSRAKKTALINQDWVEISRLAHGIENSAVVK